MMRVTDWLRLTSRATRRDWSRLAVIVALVFFLIFIVGFIMLVEIDSRDTFERMKHGRAVNNPTLARDLPDESELVAQSTPTLSPPQTRDTAVSTNRLDCRSCHLKPPSRPLRFDGATFVHAPHTEKLGLACEKCHDSAQPTFPKEAHGRVRITKEDCMSCHHWQRENCGACHGQGPASPVNFRSILFPHAKHTAAGVDCKTCHMKTIRGELRLSAIDLPTCATCHHKPSGSKIACAICHAKTIPEFVSFRDARLPHKRHTELGLECVDCHKPAGRKMGVESVCNTCHHEDGMKPNCQACHGNGPTQLVPSKWKPFPHSKHIPLGLSCGDCHTKADPTKVEAPCETCHEEARPPASPAVPATPPTPPTPAAISATATPAAPAISAAESTPPSATIPASSGTVPAVESGGR